MASLLGFLGALGDSISGDGSPTYLTRLNNAVDPLAAAQKQAALQQVQTQQSALAQLAQMRQQGVTNPQQILSSLATVDPQYLQPAADLQAKNPLASAFASFQNPAQGAPNSSAPSTQSPNQPPQQDPYAIQPEGPDDKRNYDFLNTKVPPQYRALIRQISNGDESVGNADSLRSNGMLALATMFDPSLSKTDFAIRQATAKDSAPGGKSGQAVTSANTAVKHLAQVALAGLDLHNGDNQLKNYLGNKISAWAGNDPTTNLQSVVDTVAPELAKAAASGGDTTESDRNSQKESFGIAQSPEQLLGAVAGKADLINSKMEEVGNSYKTAMGGRQRQTITADNKKILDDLKSLHQFAKDGKLKFAKDGNLDDPKAQAIVERLRGAVSEDKGATQSPAQAPSISEGATATNPQTGAKVVFKGGKWQPL